MTLDELFSLDNGFPTDAEALLAEGALPAEEESRVFARIQERAFPEKEEKRPVKKTSFGIMLFAAALVFGTVAASAAGYFQPDGRIARMLGAAPENWEGGGAAIQASQESDGWTLTVDQAVGDKNCAYILLNLTAPEGTALDAELYRLDCLLEFDGVGGGCWGCTMLEDEDKADNRLSFLLDAATEGDLRDTTGHLKAGGLVEISDDDHVRELAGLTWELDFPMRYENDPIVYRPDHTVQVEKGLVKGTIKVETVEVTPLSVRVRCTSGDGILGRVTPVTAATPMTGAVLLEVRDKEGNPIPVDSTSGRSGLHSLEEAMTFVPIIDPEQVAALSIDGVVVPLK